MQQSTSEFSAPRSSLRAARVLIVVFFLIFTALLGYLITRGYYDAVERSTTRAESASQVVATNARWIVEVAQQVLRRMDTALGPNVQTNDTGSVRDMRETIDSLPISAKAYIVDAEGRTLFTTDPNIKPVDVTDREYFSALKGGVNFYTSPLLVSRLDGQQIFVFSRRINRAGQFAGAAIVSFDVMLFKDVWTSLDMELGSTVSVVRDDGMLVARYPLADEALDLSGHVLFTEYLPKLDQGNYTSVSPVDGVQRVVSYRRVPGTSLIALASVSSAATLATFWRGVLIVLVLVLPVAIGLMIAAIWITGLLQRDAGRQQELTAALEANSLLFREIHHRVKNNLQSMLSLVRIQKLPPEVKLDLQSRFVAMAAVHEHMYQRDAFAELAATEFIPAIVEPVLLAFSEDVEVIYDIELLQIGHDRATPLALLLNEVVTNALKYAFEGRSGGTITIGLHPDEDGEDSVLTIADDGTGFDPTNVREGMGTKLIDGVVRQLDGRFAYSHENGTTFTAYVRLT